MTREPKVAQADMLASAVVHTMEQKGIMAMPVLVFLLLRHARAATPLAAPERKGG